jgi:DNA polymerase V
MREEEQHPTDAEGVSVHSGFPNPATDKAFTTLDLTSLLVEHSLSTYYFRIAGDDWQDRGVFDGDILIIDRALSARKNDLVIWWSDESSEFAVSTGAKMPQNARSWGVVTAAIHQFRKVNR